MDPIQHTSPLDDDTVSDQPLGLEHDHEDDVANDLAFDLFDRDADPEEYDHAWGQILLEFGDFDCWHEGEAWQYMGSSVKRGRWHHDFRHRLLPDSDGYTRRSYPASLRWNNERCAMAAESYRTSLSAAIDGGVEAEVWVALTERLAFVNGAPKTIEVVKAVLDGMEAKRPCRS